MSSGTTRADADSPSAATAPPRSRGNRVEERGIESVPEAERRGRPRELFLVWFSSNMSYLPILLGGSLMMLGLSTWQAVAVLLAGNTFWALVGLLAVSGPSTGSPSAVIMRVLFGVRGNRVIGCGLGWLTAVGFEAINLSITVLAGQALLSEAGIGGSAVSRGVILVLVSVVTFTISVYGYDAILRMSRAITLLLTLSLLVAAVFVAVHAHPGTDGSADAALGPLATALVGFTVVSSGPLSWLSGADYARYLPPTASRRSVAGWTAAGGWLASVFLGLVGVLAGTAVDMTDPMTSMTTLMPAWFHPVFLAAVIVGTLANNVLTSYSSGLLLQGAGVRIRRARAVLLDGVLGGGIALYALVAASFLTALNNILALSVVYMGPIIAIYALDLVLRRNRYGAGELADLRPGGSRPTGVGAAGVSAAGVIAFLAGTLAALLCVNTTLWTGPVSRWLGGADLAAVVGPLVAALGYAALTRTGNARLGRTDRSSDAPREPGAAGTTGSAGTPPVPVVDLRLSAGGLVVIRRTRRSRG
ncbi:purine-cytosine permease family protein [Streptomyces sp. CBMA123]|uniref:purine-cytosine permease family protein n=1 Tax=Streptomyces sp. CBMA123 TaxID=1896313 RepID=UPI001661FFB9|nr:cytosine permease [Streptomyces sp. CBMA123]MBD0693850.1 hypothetical protein [Streptomyces sp. CBMA123]